MKHKRPPDDGRLFLYKESQLRRKSLTEANVLFNVLSVLCKMIHLIHIRLKKGGEKLITINERSTLPIYEQIIQQMKEAILKGMLQGGEKLPSVRELSASLLVNPNTVSKAYQELERQGVIETLRGKGTFVSKRTSPRMEQERLEQFQMSLRQLTVEAFYLGISTKQFKDWVDEYMRELGRDKHA